MVQSPSGISLLRNTGEKCSASPAVTIFYRASGIGSSPLQCQLWEEGNPLTSTGGVWYVADCVLFCLGLRRLLYGKRLDNPSVTVSTTMMKASMGVVLLEVDMRVGIVNLSI